jgi:transcriptional regulator with XRE-family HTH domain
MTSARRCRCGTALAQDNAGHLCAVCQHRRLPSRHRAPEVPPGFWEHDTIAAALASGDLGRVILAYRSHPFHGRRALSQTVVADWLHVSQTSLSRIEQGKCRLTIDDISRFAGALGLSVALVWTPQPEVGEDVDPLSRRSLFGAGVGLALGATTAPAAAREIDPEIVSRWMRLLDILIRHDAMCGPHEALGIVNHQIAMIAEYRQVARGELRTQLQREESRWSWFAGWLGHDGGDPRLCDYWADRAVRLAREIDHQDMVAWVLTNRSQWAATREDARQAVALAAAAGRTGGVSTYLRALCALRVAHGHALAGDAASCERRIADAHRLLDHRDTSNRDLGGHAVTPPYVMADEARCWLGLRPRKAITMLEDALRLWPRDSTRGRGIHQARLALACAYADEPERAASEGADALDIARSTGSDVLTRQLKRLDHHLAGYDVPAVADFREAYAAL